MNYNVTPHRQPRQKPPSGKFSLAKLWRIVIRWLVISLVGVGVIGLGGWWLQGQLARLWPLRETITLVLIDPQSGSSTDPWLIQLHPESQTITLVAVPAEQTTELFSGYGQYKISAVYPLLELDHRSPAYVRATFSAISGSLVTEVIPWPGLTTWHQDIQKAKILNNSDQSITQTSLRRLGELPLSFLTEMYWKKVWSPGLNLSDRVHNFKAWQVAWQWRWFAEQTQLHWVWGSDLKSLQPTSSSVANQCPIAVINATEVQGLARQVSAVLTANGYSIVRTTVDSAVSEQSHIWLDPALAQTCQSVAERISTILPTAPKPEENDQQPKRYRAPIVITVGGDITQ